MPKTRRYALTAGRLAAAAAYVQLHAMRFSGHPPKLADRYETPVRVRRTLERIYGTARIPGDGEVAYWSLDDDGVALGLLDLWRTRR
jgi:hypothetical protein